MKFMKALPLHILLIVSVMGLAACSSKAVRKADTHYDIAISIPSTSFGTSAEVMLRRVDIRGLQSGRSLVHITGDNPPQFQEERGHFWHVAAPTLLERAIDNAMQTASTDATFGTNSTISNAGYSYTIDMIMFAFEPAGDARIAFQATVKDSRGKIVLSDTYKAIAPLGSAGPANGVRALGEGMSAALSAFAADLASAI